MRKSTFAVQVSGAVLSDMVRAYMHTACPSALLVRIVEGLKEFEAECASERDREFTNKVRGLLESWLQEVRAAEQTEYSR